jgi:hypothetical protein
MTYKISRCSICGQLLQSKKGLKEHKDRNHRITNSKMMTMMPEITTKPAAKNEIIINNKIAEG